MGDPVTINLRYLARGLGIPVAQVHAVVELLDEGNTVPFITRYRKDQTGGLDEEQIRQIQTRLAKLRMLAERKQTILRSIESQGKLTEKLAKLIHAAGTTKRLEDLYLPYRPKKQTLATVARGRGLETLAHEILEASPACADLDARAADFVNPDREVTMAADALLGAGHILAEWFSEQAKLRQRLREVLQRSGKLRTNRIDSETKAVAQKPHDTSLEQPLNHSSAETHNHSSAETHTHSSAETHNHSSAETHNHSSAEKPIDGQAKPEQPPSPGPADLDSPRTETDGTVEPPQPGEGPAEEKANPREGNGDATPPSGPPSGPAAPGAKEKSAQQRPGGQVASKKRAREQRKLSRKEQKKKQAQQKIEKAFHDYFDYSEEIKKIPSHRVLAINRGERTKVLRAKIECDTEAMYRVLDELCVPADHPHAEFLRGCCRDALSRLILPSLEREARRELTDRAEAHAVSVFARNLRNLLLQPPVSGRRVLAVDPGYKSGCKLVALDQFGNVLAHGVIYLVGKPERKVQARRLVTELIDRFQPSVVTIGNGSACRQTEDFFAELIGGELKDRELSYVIVNEAGASVYSTSRVGREEFPHYDATLRGAISIGRRLLDPLSELVKIDPANIGVGLYQHDVKAKHLRACLDEVVESCVNYVGVDVNTASPALLRYVSGLNQLTARRLCEHRLEHGPFRNREQFRQVLGFGEMTFIQSAGFLKITSGDNSLDATWIHPESYQVAARVISEQDSSGSDSACQGSSGNPTQAWPKEKTAALAEELGVGARLLEDILVQLARPGRDPREDLPPPVFKRGVVKLEDLEVGMELTGTVLNVVDFGAFVDIGMHDSGLVHVSQLADKFVRDPHDAAAVGDVVKVWVMEVDKTRRRVSLTMIPPGTRRSAPQRDEKDQQQPTTARSRRPRGERKPRGKGPPRSREKGPPKYRPKRQPKRQPKPVVPITNEMASGLAPMRTFGDLAQFFQGKIADPAQTEKKESPKEGRKKPDAQDKPPTEEQNPPTGADLNIASPDRSSSESPGTDSSDPGS